MKVKEILRRLKVRPVPCSAWDKGVRWYAEQRLEVADQDEEVMFPRNFFLNGAKDFNQLSHGGGWVPFRDEDVVRILCPPSIQKRVIRKDGTAKIPYGCNGDYWMGEIQVDALRQAAELIADIVREESRANNKD